MAQTTQRSRTTTARPRPQQQQAPQPATNQGAVALARARLPMPLEAERAGIEPGVWRSFVDVVWPSAKSPEAIMLAFQYCKSRNLDPMKRPVHIVPIYSSVLERMTESVWPGIGELRTTAMRTKDYAGMDDARIGPMKTETLDSVTLDYPQWAQVTVYRLDRLGEKRAIIGPKVYWKEAYATAKRDTVAPNAMWKKRPIGQLVKCAEAAALRAGFPEEIGNTYSSDEMWGQIIDHVPTADGSVPPAPRRQDYIEHVEPPNAAAPAQQPQQPQQPQEPVFDVVDADGVIAEYRRFQAADALINAMNMAAERRDKAEALRGINAVVHQNQQTLDAIAQWSSQEHARVVERYRDLTRNLDPFGLPGTGAKPPADQPSNAAGSDNRPAGEAAGSSNANAPSASVTTQPPHDLRFPAPPSRERGWTVWGGEMAAAIRSANDRGRLADLNGEARRYPAAPQSVLDDLYALLDERSREI